MKLIVISGSVGVGKEKLAKFLVRKVGYSRLNLHSYYKQISTSYDPKKKCYVVDLNKFKALVTKTLNKLKRKPEKGLIIDSHIAHLLSKRMVDLCIILICSNLKKLQKNLEKRGYSRRKIRENLDTEIFQVCLVEAREQGHKIIVFEMGNKVNNHKILAKITKSL